MARVAFLRVQPVLNTHTNTQSSSYLLLFRSMCANIARRYFPKRAVCTYCCYCCAICCVCVCGVFCFADMHSHARSGRFVYYLIVHSPERNNVCNSYNILAHTQHTLSVVSFILCCREWPVYRHHYSEYIYIWSYRYCMENICRDGDMANFGPFALHIRSAFAVSRHILTAAVAAGASVLTHTHTQTLHFIGHFAICVIIVCKTCPSLYVHFI